MERINIPKHSMLKEIILSGLDGRGFTCAKRTKCTATPIYLYYNQLVKTIVIFRCGITIDELVIINYNIPAKVKVIINEYYTFNDNCRTEIAEILEKILDGSYFVENAEVTYL